MGLTINRLHKELGKLIEDGHGRKPVSINKNSFIHALETDGCIILPVKAIGVEWVPTISDEGGFKENADGSESGKNVCVLSGKTS